MSQPIRCILVRHAVIPPPPPSITNVDFSSKQRCVDKSASRAGCSCPRCPCCRTVEPRRHGVTAHDCWDGDRVRYRVQAMLPGQTIFTDCLRKLARRARDAAASMWRLRRNQTCFEPAGRSGCGRPSTSQVGLVRALARPNIQHVRVDDR